MGWPRDCQNASLFLLSWFARLSRDAWAERLFVGLEGWCFMGQLLSGCCRRGFGFLEPYLDFESANVVFAGLTAEHRTAP
ncbi:hypothetical protein ACLESD_25500 [Pyxidicoccus sp. 3LFB2]